MPFPFAVYTENAQGQLKESLWQVCSVSICLLLECPSFEMGAAKKQHSLTKYGNCPGMSSCFAAQRLAMMNRLKRPRKWALNNFSAGSQVGSLVGSLLAGGLAGGQLAPEYALKGGW